MVNEATMLEMDEPREIKWNFSAIKNFEMRSKMILTRLHVTIPNIVKIDGRAVEAGTVPIANATALRILGDFVKMAEILEVAVGAATGLSYLEIKGEPSPAAKAIDCWMAKGNSLDDLAETLYGEFLHASNPLAFARWQESRKKQEAATE
jgi:hypothetical protein